MNKNIIKALAILTILLVIFIRFFMNTPKSNSLVIEEEIKTTKDKSIIFFGDSIMSGWLTKGEAVPEYIEDNYDFKLVINASIEDYRVSSYDNNKNWLLDQMKPYLDDEYDYVILQGGINDMLLKTPLGNITSSNFKGEFDTDTYAGGLEKYISTAKENYKDAKIGYVISYYVPNYQEENYYWSYKDQDRYVKTTIAILEKYDIPYINLFEDRYSKLLKVDTKVYLPDYLHPNKEGYELLYPIIYEWIKEL